MNYSKKHLKRLLYVTNANRSPFAIYNDVPFTMTYKELIHEYTEFQKVEKYYKGGKYHATR